MRSLSLHYGTIQIASIGGESRRVSVSGLSKARLLWLFRNFSILEFPVLSKQQQQLIYQMWNSGKRIPPKEAPRDMIGRIEAFSPQLCEKDASSPQTTPVHRTTTKRSSPQQAAVERSSNEPGSERLCSDKPGQPRARFSLLRAGLRDAAGWRAFTILLLGAAMYFGPRYLPPKHPHTPQTQVPAVADEKQRTRSTPVDSEALPPAQSSAKAAPAKAAAAHAAAVPAPAPVVASASSSVPAPASSSGESNGVPGAPAVGVLGRNGVPDAPAVGVLGRNVSVAAPDLPEAMAHEASLPQVAPRQQRSVADARPQEVLIRVSVSAAGQAQNFQILRGHQEKQRAALKAARLWNFRPCAGGEACDQVLKFTDYGDSSRVQRIE